MTEMSLEQWGRELKQNHPEMFAGEQSARRAKKGARSRWHPLYLRVYGVRPWEMGKFTLGELNAMTADLNENGIGL